jgi:signal transduction histidine kinase
LASRLRKETVGYVAVVAGCFAVGMLAALTSFALRIDHYAYDLMLGWQANEIWTPQSVIVAIDEQTLSVGHGVPHIRQILTEALGKIAAAEPTAVALDVTLHDDVDEAGDKRLAAALHGIKNLILPCDEMIVNNVRKWEDPSLQFMERDTHLGHVHLEKTDVDGVRRQIPLMEIIAGERRWALALESFRVARGQRIIESPDDLQMGSVLIPASRASGYPMRIRYLPPGVIPTVPAIEIEQHKEMLRGKTVFLGITALSAAHDRQMIPPGYEVAGVEIHAQAFETMARMKFLTPVPDHIIWALCVLIAVAVGLTFELVPGWWAYAAGALLLALAHWTPLEFFRHGIVFPFFAPVSVAWLTTVGAASFQHFFVRRQLRQSESEKSRYQQAIHWVAHEMRTPLTSIQGSSEIMTRYSLSEEKRQQLSEMINSESKRLARMIQTFLDVERLADGQMELKREPFPAAAVVESCVKRIALPAERKQISVHLDTPIEGTVTGDRELLEYAFYNLLTNAVKYSPSNTEIRVTAEMRGTELRLAVRDQGIGMDSRELKSIFKKFYRTKRAEASGEVGTGIGLSIVEQIVTYHGGRMEVTSEPGKGSCFTMILAASEVAAVSPNAKTLDRRG